MKKLDTNMMIYVAYTLDPRYKTSMIKDMMPDKADKVLAAVRKYFTLEWPELARHDSPSSSIELAAMLDTRPEGVSLAQ